MSKGRKTKSDDNQQSVNNSKESVAQIQKDRDEYLAGWQRALADYRNLQASLQAREQIIRTVTEEKILSDLIQLADSFDMAFADSQAWQAVDANWRQGIEQIYNQLQAIFNTYGLVKIKPTVGEDFDPNYHESVDTEAVTDQARDGKIIAELKAGYKLKDKVLRPVQVKVGVYNQNN